MVEIPVAGAGPAGLAAALTLARAGARPVVYERRQEVGARHHGDFQGLENYSTRGDVLDELAAIGIAAKGYAYLVTAGGRATLACCIFADCANYRGYLDRTVSFFQARTGIDLAGAQRFGGTGNVRLPATARRNGGGTLLAGEAAGF